MKPATKGEKTRERILDVAIALFAEDGATNVSVSEIARKAKLSQPAVLKHFPAKEDIYQAVIERIVRSNHAFVSERLDDRLLALEALVLHTRLNLEWASKYRAESSNLLFLYYLAGTRPFFRKLYETVLSTGRERIHSYFVRAAKERGLERSARETRSMAIDFHNALIGYFVNAVAEPHTLESLPVIERRFSKLAGLLLVARA